MLEFNEQLHEYRYDGVKIPSVTQVISDVGLSSFNGINSRMLEIACQRGSFVHLACELYDKGQLDENTVDEELLGYLNGWKAFCNDFRPEFIEIEKMYYSKLGFAGTLDREALINKRPTLIDIKTGGKSKAHEVQNGGYKILLKENSITGIYADSLMVYLSNDNSYKIEPHKTNKGQQIFLSALEVYKYKHGV